MNNRESTANQEYKGSDLEIADQVQAEVTANKSPDKTNKSKTEMEFVSNFNPDDFEGDIR
ncbi:MAG: hypothetical protein GX308_00655 [Epulopiscium sp.]|nr:hypothetical protein [Candidatus Epulonipiscium sp.]